MLLNIYCLKSEEAYLLIAAVHLSTPDTRMNNSGMLMSLKLSPTPLVLILISSEVFLQSKRNGGL